MQIDKQTMVELAEIISKSVVNALEERGLVGKANKLKVPMNEKSAYAKTEALLYNYKGFIRIVEERMKEIDDLRKYGVPKSCAVTEFVNKGGYPQGIVLESESVEAAVHNVERSVQDTVQVINMINKCMSALKSDPYYKILEMRYFEGRTQEDIALEFNCTQQTISNNKSRLVRELAMRLFPNQVVKEMVGN